MTNKKISLIWVNMAQLHVPISTHVKELYKGKIIPKRFLGGGGGGGG